MSFESNITERVQASGYVSATSAIEILEGLESNATVVHIHDEPRDLYTSDTYSIYKVSVVIERT